ncbi:hypothetical protein ACVIW2_003341 [Bradyrhizobium huanghuaihaiense]|uniref:hypothetical protein n=1 Tax=Bradyrhizobium TaxID=374 RepID=UPI001315096A|nr:MULTISPECIES: hypothetical protein [Bradyrhizobium]WFU22964.1 hypothetical protein QA649_33515 [Bradyrhizobium sp. CB1717]
MIADVVYLAFAGLGVCHAACRSVMSDGFKAGMFGLRPLVWRWPRSRNHRASIKSR